MKMEEIYKSMDKKIKLEDECTVVFQSLTAMGHAQLGLGGTSIMTPYHLLQVTITQL